MKLKKEIILIFCITFFIQNNIIASGNLNNFELGTAMYRDLDDTFSAQHYHAAVYLYFEYINGTGKMYFAHQGGSSGSSSASGGLSVEHSDPVYIGLSVSNLATLKTSLINKFKNGHTYHGTYSRIVVPSTLSAIAATAKELGHKSDDIGYTWVDMIDPENDHWQNWPPGWYEHWDGTIGDIDEIRCDGVVEFSYEEHGVEVANDMNIAGVGNYRVDRHNDFHNGDYQWPELCPRIQAGENHRGSGTSHSLFDPLISGIPVSNDFSTNQYEYTQLNFKISDNASVKSYVLLQVKKTSESTWHVLKDKNNNIWKFKAVDLTEYSNNTQFDYFHIPWDGKYDGGHYATGTSNYNLKITVIDQGANYSVSTYNFTATIPALELTISGPTSLGDNEQGTFTANPSGGGVTYTNYRWWWRNDAGGGVGPESVGFDNGIDYVPPGDSWYELTSFEGQQTITIGKPDDFSLKCEVTDSDNNTAEDIHSIVVNGSLAKAQGATTDKLSMIVVPGQLELTGNYPNPFNPSTTIRFGLSEDGYVKITIYSINGQKVITLANGYYSKGYHEIKWNGENYSGRLVSNGLYITELKVGNQRLIKKMVFAK